MTSTTTLAVTVGAEMATGILQGGSLEGVGSAIDLLRTVLTIAFVAVGSFFLIVGTLGLLRLPNVYNRLHATSKATTLGAASIFLAGFFYFGPQGSGLVSLVGIVFLFLTTPTGAHMISRAAGKMGVDFEEGVVWPVTDLEDRPTGDGGGGEDSPTAAPTDEDAEGARR